MFHVNQHLPGLAQQICSILISKICSQKIKNNRKKETTKQTNPTTHTHSLSTPPEINIEGIDVGRAEESFKKDRLVGLNLVAIVFENLQDTIEKFHLLQL